MTTSWTEPRTTDPQASTPGIDGQWLRVQFPRVLQESWSDACEHAQRELEPVFVPVTCHADDRGWSLMNLLVGVMSERGQINFSTQYPGVIKAWHRHHRQTDFWCCLTGHLKAGIWRESDGKAWLQVFGEKKPGVLIIPPPLWHGAVCIGAEPAGLFYYVTHAYDPHQPDEDRRPHDSIDGFPWGVRHG